MFIFTSAGLEGKIPVRADSAAVKQGVLRAAGALSFSRRAHLLTTRKRAVVSLPLVGHMRSPKVDGFADTTGKREDVSLI